MKIISTLAIFLISLQAYSNPFFFTDIAKMKLVLDVVEQEVTCNVDQIKYFLSRRCYPGIDEYKVSGVIITKKDNRYEKTREEITVAVGCCGCDNPQDHVEIINRVVQ